MVSTRGVFRTQSNIYGGLFCENSKQPLAVTYFLEKAPSKMFGWVLNTPLNTIIFFPDVSKLKLLTFEFFILLLLFF